MIAREPSEIVQDWMISADQLPARARPEDDFVIGHDLISGEGLTEDFSVVADTSNPAQGLQEILFEDLRDLINDLPDPEVHLTKPASAWREITRSEEKEITFTESEAADLGDLAASLLEVHRIRGDLHARVEAIAKETLEAENIIDPGQMELMRQDAAELRRGIEEQASAVQQWVNKAILDGNLERMHGLNRAKHAIFETQVLLRKVERAVGLSQSPSSPARRPLEEVETTSESVVDVPEFSQTKYATPVGRTKVREQTKVLRDERGHRVTGKSQAAAPRLRAAMPSIHLPAVRAKQIALLLLLIAIPLSYVLSARRHQVPREEINTYQYSTLLDMKKAYKVKDNFVGQVKDDFRALSAEQRRRQVQDLVNQVKGEGYNVVALYYPDGKPAANYLFGSIIVY